MAVISIIQRPPMVGSAGEHTGRIGGLGAGTCRACGRHRQLSAGIAVAMGSSAQRILVHVLKTVVGIVIMGGRIVAFGSIVGFRNGLHIQTSRSKLIRFPSM